MTVSTATSEIFFKVSYGLFSFAVLYSVCAKVIINTAHVWIFHVSVE